MFLRRRLIWRLPYLLPLSPFSRLEGRHSGRLRERDNLLTGEGVAWSQMLIKISEKTMKCLKELPNVVSFRTRILYGLYLRRNKPYFDQRCLVLFKILICTGALQNTFKIVKTVTAKAAPKIL